MGMAPWGGQSAVWFRIHLHVPVPVPVPLPGDFVAREKLSSRVILSALRDHLRHSLYKIPPSSFALLDPPGLRLARESNYAVFHGSLQKRSDTKGSDRAKLLHNYRRGLAHV